MRLPRIWPRSKQGQRDINTEETESRARRLRRWVTRGALVLSVAAISGTVATMVMDQRSRNIGELPPLDFPPVVAEATRNVSEAEALDMLASMLNLTGWAGETTTRAEDGQGFYKALLTGPGIECGQRPDGQYPRSVEEVSRCVRAELERRSQAVPSWDDMSREYRQAAAMRALERTWWAKSPESMLQVRTAYLRGLLMDREDPEFREFAELFDPCLANSYPLAEAIADAPDEREAGTAYVEAVIGMEQCASNTMAARFPKPATPEAEEPWVPATE